MSRYFSVPNALDVSVALLDISRWAAVQTLSRSPDYFFYDQPSANLFVVECKGNQSSKNESYHQLQSGSEQLPSIVFADGRAVTSLVIATCLLEDSTEVYVIDPPPKPDGDEPADPRKARREGEQTWRVHNAAKFQTDIQRLRAGKLLVYSGDYPEAIKLAPSDLPDYQAALGVPPRQLSLRENEFGTFEGTAEQILTGDGVQMRLFRGISLPLKRAVIAHPEDFDADERIANLTSETGYVSRTAVTRQGATVTSVSSSGAMLEISIESE